ncbi:MAG: arylamine N-acetyltransferase [Saccharospirillaceae bacterium]|nr:arylamine N-acetyltransferase [Pseudomonadales bacterium]NRB77543.1 arylamine N-acetyltransferase [Saccharospirillaceae bacterium]
MPLHDSFNIYLADLNLEIPKQLNLTFVNALIAKHVARYSFNSLAVNLGEDISLDVDLIIDKLVNRQFGGYCFEHNKVVFECLKQLGFDVELKLAQVLYNKNTASPRTHRITLLNLDNKQYILDAGFGGFGPVTPLLLKANIEQISGSDTYKLLESNAEYVLQIFKDGEFFSLFRFDFANYSDFDCELSHFYSHKHKQASFVNNLLVSLKTSTKLAVLKNHQLKSKNAALNTEQIITITSPEQLNSTLLSEFKLDIDIVICQHLFDRFIKPNLEC